MTPASMPSISLSSVPESFPGALALTVVEDKPWSGRLATLDEASGGAIRRAAEAGRFRGEKGKIQLVLGAGEGLPARIVLCGMGKESPSLLDLNRAGAQMLATVATSGDESLYILPHDANAATAALLVEGAAMRSYRFDGYRTRLKDEQRQSVTSIVGLCDNPSSAAADDNLAQAAGRLAGHYLARDLKHEPANVLHPMAFAERVRAELEPLGVEVTLIDEARMKKEGWGSLLGVGQGSIRDSVVVAMHWKGASGGVHKDPICFVGKGVCFDTGGISLKPAGGMEDMKWDMGGAAAVSGLMKTLATRKAKANVVGLIGLVENMPDGNAQRPGDIVTSLSGQTIQVLNTDAEGRLVLADVLWHAQEQYRPRFIVDLATLTGAMLVALGMEKAGLFSNDDELAAQIHDASEATGEYVWRMPLGEEYNKMLDSKEADMRNISAGRWGGSITAACFLERFIQKDQKWAHMDVAGVVWADKAKPMVGTGATGFAVRSLNKLVRDHYEG